jgi:hypothetical protein
MFDSTFQNTFQATLRQLDNEGPQQFIFTVKTDNAGTSTSVQFTVPTVSGGTYDCVVDWGDGSVSDITTWNDAAWTHTYSSAGTYTIRISGVIIGFAFNEGGDCLKYLSTEQVGIFDHGNEDGAFNGAENHVWNATDLDYIPGTTNLRTFWGSNSSIVNIPGLGKLINRNITSLKGTFISDEDFNEPSISQADTSGATTFQNMFNGCVNFNQDISNFNFEAINVTTGFVGFMTFSTAFSTENYSKLLISMATQTILAGQTPNFGDATWPVGYGGQARFDMLSDGTFSSVTDGGQADSTLSVWLNAHNLLKTTANPADGTAVATWSDLSDNGNDAAQATSGNQPVFKTNVANGEPGVLWDGDNDRLDIADATSIQDIFNSATGGFCIAVFKAPTEGEVIGRVWGKYASDGSSIGNVLYLNDNGTSGKMSIFWQKDFSTNQGAWEVVDGIDKNEVMIVMYHYSGADVANDPTFYINSKTAVATQENQTPVGTVKGDSGRDLNVGNANGSSRTFDGHIFELLLFKEKNPTTQEISDYFDYFSDKYGVTLT